MDAHISISGLDQYGVSLISPEAPSFDSLARPLIGSRADRVLRMKPMLVVVSNDSLRTIVAISLTWRVSRREGGLTERTNSMFPHLVCGDQLIARGRAGVRAGERHLVAAGCVVEGLDAIGGSDSWIEHFVHERDRAVADAVTVAIGLDAVIFEDGTLIGPNDGGWLTDLFSTYVAAKQEWYRKIISRLDSGMTVDAAYEPVRAFQQEALERMHSGDHRALHDLSDLWRTQAAAEAQSWRRQFSDAEVPSLIKGIRLDPFVVVRAHS